MNKAAQSLFVSQSALSSAILEVEKDLGFPIFRRSNRGISLTEDGRELVSQITPIVEQCRKLSRYYGRRKDADRVHLSVSAQRYPFCAKAFVCYLNSLGTLPMQLSLKETDMAAVIGDVATGLSDLGVIFISDRTENYIIRSLEEKNLVFEPLVTLHPHVFMRKDHPLSAETSITLDQLRPYPHVVFTQSESNLNYAEEAVYGSGVDFERMVYVSDRASIYNVMAHTDCVSTGSGVLPDGYADDRLIAIPLRDACDMRLGYVHQRLHTLSDAEQHFIEILRKTTAVTE
jgi:DNA-binding transcriptional LysR family regulator